MLCSQCCRDIVRRARWHSRSHFFFSCFLDTSECTTRGSVLSMVWSLSASQLLPVPSREVWASDAATPRLGEEAPH